MSNKEEWMQKRLEPCPQTTPCIAGLARQAFYTKNIFRFSFSYNLSGTVGMLQYPNPSLNHMVRNLDIRMHLSNQHFNLLSRLATGSFGFEGLQYVQVRVNVSDYVKQAVDCRIQGPSDGPWWFQTAPYETTL